MPKQYNPFDDPEMEYTGEVEGDALKRLADLAVQQVEIEKEIEDLEALVADANRRLRAVKEVSLPDAMTEAGVADFSLTDGSKVKVEQFINGCIRADKKEQAYTWLVDNGHGDIIKHEVVSKFGKQEDERAKEIAELLRNRGVSFDDKQSVHGGTLNAFIKEQLNLGKQLPESLFSVYIGNRTKITRKKKTK